MIWVIYALLSAFTAALVAIFAKVGLSTIDSTVATALRSLVMTLVMGIVLVILRKSPEQLTHVSSSEWLFIILAGISGALSWIFYFIALKEGNAYQVVGIDRLSIVFTLIMSVLILGEPVTLKAILGVGTMMLGAFLLIQ